MSNKVSGGFLARVRADHKTILTRLVSAIRQRQYSIRTEQAYEGWTCRYIAFHGSRPPEAMGAAQVRAFLEHLVVEGKVSASTQNQALNALVFLYDKVLEQPFGDLEQFARSKRPRRLPVVLSRQDARTLIGALSGVHRLMAGLLYGSGMRLMECIRLRVQDVDFDYQQIVVRNAKGNKDRVVPLPQRSVTPLRDQLAEARRLRDKYLELGFGEVYLPEALARKWPNAARE